MKVLYIGDIQGAAGRSTAARVLPDLKRKYSPDIILAQAENVTHGKGISVKHYHELKDLGIDAFMSGNHIFAQKSIIPALEDATQPITRPANYPEGTPGMRFKVLKSSFGSVLLVSLLGKIIGKDADKPVDNPLHVVDEILAKHGNGNTATIVNFHGDYSSEKVVIGQYLDGRVTAVIGDHWHVPTADARILPKGTAHISDVGMVGTLNSSLGIDTNVIIKRWRGEAQGRNILDENPPFQFCAVVLDVDTTTGLAKGIKPVVTYLED